MPNFGSESDLAVNVNGGWGIESSPLSAAQEAALDLRLAPASLCRPSQRGGISVLKCAKNLRCAQGCVPQGSGTQVRDAATASLALRGHQPVLLLSNWALVSEPQCLLLPTRLPERFPPLVTNTGQSKTLSPD